MRLSGPAAREFPLFLIACETIPGEKQDTELSSRHSLWSFRMTIRAIFTLRVRDLDEKVMGWMRKSGPPARFPLRDSTGVKGYTCVSMIQRFGSTFVYWSFWCCGEFVH